MILFPDPRLLEHMRLWQVGEGLSGTEAGYFGLYLEPRILMSACLGSEFLTQTIAVTTVGVKLGVKNSRKQLQANCRFWICGKNTSGQPVLMMLARA